MFKSIDVEGGQCDHEARAIVGADVVELSTSSYESIDSSLDEVVGIRILKGKYVTKLFGRQRASVLKS